MIFVNCKCRNRYWNSIIFVNNLKIHRKYNFVIRAKKNVVNQKIILVNTKKNKKQKIICQKYNSSECDWISKHFRMKWRQKRKIFAVTAEIWCSVWYIFLSKISLSYYSNQNDWSVNADSANYFTTFACLDWNEKRTYLYFKTFFRPFFLPMIACACYDKICRV